MRFRETSASEPLMRCRKVIDDVKTGGFDNSRISPGGTCRPDVKGETQVEDPWRVPMRETGAD